jgi:large subunit ribosomal protein L9
MKVVLLKDVRNIGRAHSVIDVADGHALNYLIPGKLAVLATVSSMKNAAQKESQVSEKRSVEATLIKERIAALAEGQTVITKKANELGHLYDAVDAKDVAEATQLPVEVIALEKPLKELGRHEIAISSGENFGKITIDIVAE